MRNRLPILLLPLLLAGCAALGVSIRFPDASAVPDASFREMRRRMRISVGGLGRLEGMLGAWRFG